MASKNFTAAPKPKTPSPEEIAAFEQGGAGHDKPTAVTRPVSKKVATNKPQASTEPTKRLSLDLPQSLHTRFKTACSATNSKMVNEIQAFIEKRTKALEQEAGISHK